MDYVRVLVFDPTNRSPFYLGEFTFALSRLAHVGVIAPSRGNENYPTPDSVSLEWVWREHGEGSAARRLCTYFRAWGAALHMSDSYDVIHIQWLAALDRWPLDLYAMRLLMRRNGRVAYTVHNVVPHGLEDDAKVASRYGSLYATVPLLFVHSLETREELVQRFGIAAEKVVVVPHGPLFLQRAAGSRRHEYVAAMIGNIMPYKGAEDALLALALLRSEFPCARLLLAGKFERGYKSFLVNKARELGVGSAVTVVDRHLTNSELVDLHARCLMVVLPYRHISQSGAALTAVGLGVPIVAYRVGGLTDLIEQGVNGFVVPPGDVGLLAARMTDVLRHRDSFERGASDLARRTSWEQNARLTVEAYSALLGSQTHTREC